MSNNASCPIPDADLADLYGQKEALIPAVIVTRNSMA